MDFNRMVICYGTVVQLLVMRCLGAEPLPCYIGDNFNQTLDNTIHLSDVILAGRIVTKEKGDLGTYSAEVSYHYSYKSDEFLLIKALSHSKVTNFASPPPTWTLGIFFLVREPSMQLALFCMTPVDILMQNTEGSYQNVIKHIIDVGSSK